MDTYTPITESLCCTPETNTTLLINFTPILKKKLKIINKIKMQKNTDIKYILRMSY